MIRYSPPKSQVWGHQVGRLSAAEVVERSFQFLERCCAVTSSQPTSLFVSWRPTHDSRMVGLEEKIDGQLGRPSFSGDMADSAGTTFRQRSWSVTAEDLPAIAPWFDLLADDIATGEVVAHCSVMWMFAWKNEPLPLRPLGSAGGMFGVHLSRPHRITTMFTFRDMQQYARIRDELHSLGLAELSDRHLRPKPRPG